MKVVTFCVWGTDLKYLVGIIKNARLVQELYKGWQCRVYVAQEVPTSVRYELKNIANTNVIEVDRVGDWTFSYNRFLPMSEPDVSVMISRDADSRLTIREKMAVDEWLASDKGFHIMKDHPWHYTYPILAGMFGCKSGVINDISKKIESFSKTDWYHSDQEFLKQIVFPEIKDKVLVHDDWNATPFPIGRENFQFVGQIFDEDDTTVQHHIDVLKSAVK